MKSKPMYIIKDWAGNKPCGDMTFKEFDDAWDHISSMLEKQYGIPSSEDQEKMFEDAMGEFEVEEV